MPKVPILSTRYLRGNLFLKANNMLANDNTYEKKESKESIPGAGYGVTQESLFWNLPMTS